MEWPGLFSPVRMQIIYLYAYNSEEVVLGSLGQSFMFLWMQITFGGWIETVFVCLFLIGFIF